MIVCLCRNVSDGAIRAAVAAGARSADDVARATGAGTECGCCRPTVERIVRAACSASPCPGCPNAPDRAPANGPARPPTHAAGRGAA